MTSDTARLDARLLYRYLSGMSEVELITLSESLVSDEAICSYKKIIERRKTGMPVAYLTGAKEFWSLELNVTQDTLIPRPETELLVESALQLIDKSSISQVLDLGTGSGAIALAIASERPSARLVAVDNRSPALTIAQGNAQKLNITNVSFIYSDWFKNLNDQHFDIILGNPPYIRAGDTHLLQGDIKHEPASALVSGHEGLDDLKKIIRNAVKFLNKGGWLLLEHGYDQSDEVCLLFKTSGFVNIETKYDLSQKPRITMGQFN